MSVNGPIPGPEGVGPGPGARPVVALRVRDVAFEEVPV